VRAVIQRSLEVLNAHTHHTFLRREETQGESGVSSCQVRSRIARRNKPPSHSPAVPRRTPEWVDEVQPG
jgi:hypothetical protein